MIEVKAPDEFIAELWTYAEEVPTIMPSPVNPVQNHRQSEVADLGSAVFGEPYVARLQVAVNDAPAVGELQPRQVSMVMAMAWSKGSRWPSAFSITPSTSPPPINSVTM